MFFVKEFTGREEFTERSKLLPQVKFSVPDKNINILSTFVFTFFVPVWHRSPLYNNSFVTDYCRHEECNGSLFSQTVHKKKPILGSVKRRLYPKVLLGLMSLNMIESRGLTPSTTSSPSFILTKDSWHKLSNTLLIERFSSWFGLRWQNSVDLVR